VAEELGSHVQRDSAFGWTHPLSTSGETLTIEESMKLEARTENAGMLETSTNGAAVDRRVR
jgi:hypothetical protein